MSLVIPVSHNVVEQLGIQASVLLDSCSKGEVARANSLSLLWVSGHSGVIGNEKTDRLANRGFKAVRATRCSVGLPACYLDE